MNVIQNLPKKTICEICKIARQHKLYPTIFRLIVVDLSRSPTAACPRSCLAHHSNSPISHPFHHTSKSTLHCRRKKKEKTSMEKTNQDGEVELLLAQG
jgi:hypothetical protein